VIYANVEYFVPTVFALTCDDDTIYYRLSWMISVIFKYIFDIRQTCKYSLTPRWALTNSRLSAESSVAKCNRL
jgi:hypothetical protein